MISPIQQVLSLQTEIINEGLIEVFKFSTTFVHFLWLFTPKLPKHPNDQSANMAHLVAIFILGFRKI